MAIALPFKAGSGCDGVCANEGWRSDAAIKSDAARRPPSRVACMIGAFSFRGFDGPDLRGYQTPQSSLKSALMARHALINRRMAFAASVKGECGGGSRHNPSPKLAGACGRHVRSFSGGRYSVMNEAASRPEPIVDRRKAGSQRRRCSPAPSANAALRRRSAPESTARTRTRTPARQPPIFPGVCRFFCERTPPKWGVKQCLSASAALLRGDRARAGGAAAEMASDRRSPEGSQPPIADDCVESSPALSRARSIDCGRFLHSGCSYVQYTAYSRR